MRTHASIIRDAGGAHAVARMLLPATGVAEATLQSRVRGWVLSSSIPGEYWSACAELGVAGLEELAAAAALKRQRVSA